MSQTDVEETCFYSVSRDLVKKLSVLASCWLMLMQKVTKNWKLTAEIKWSH